MVGRHPDGPRNSLGCRYQCSDLEHLEPEAEQVGGYQDAGAVVDVMNRSCVEAEGVCQGLFARQVFSRPEVCHAPGHGVRMISEEQDRGGRGVGLCGHTLCIHSAGHSLRAPQLRPRLHLGPYQQFLRPGLGAMQRASRGACGDRVREIPRSGEDLRVERVWDQL